MFHGIGTSVQLFGNLTGGAAIALSVDNTPVQASSSNTDGALATVENLSNDQHVISLTVSTTGAPNSFVVFDRAIIDTVVNSTHVTFVTLHTDHLLTLFFVFFFTEIHLRKHLSLPLTSVGWDIGLTLYR
jgi:hypothetical protein